MSTAALKRIKSWKDHKDSQVGKAYRAQFGDVKVLTATEINDIRDAFGYFNDQISELLEKIKALEELTSTLQKPIIEIPYNAPSLAPQETITDSIDAGIDINKTYSVSVNNAYDDDNITITATITDSVIALRIANEGSNNHEARQLIIKLQEN